MLNRSSNHHLGWNTKVFPLYCDVGMEVGQTIITLGRATPNRCAGPHRKTSGQSHRNREHAENLNGPWCASCGRFNPPLPEASSVNIAMVGCIAPLSQVFSICILAWTKGDGTRIFWGRNEEQSEAMCRPLVEGTTQITPHGVRARAF
jgi:hypothetical protein